MNQYNNSVKICTNPPEGDYTLSLSNTKQAIALTNNRARYYAELAEKYKNEAKEHRDNAQYYAEQNSDVTFGYINTIKSELIAQIDTKQNAGDYALKGELPTKVSELYNDSNFAILNDVINRDTDILEQVNEGLELKVDKSSMFEVPCITETYVNGTSGYVVWSNGLCWQWGQASTSPVVFLKPYKTTPNIQLVQHSDAAGPNNNPTVRAISLDQFAYYSERNIIWQAIGYIA